jgi:hypothetical protein
MKLAYVDCEKIFLQGLVIETERDFGKNYKSCMSYLKKLPLIRIEAPLLIMILKYCHPKIKKICVSGKLSKTVSSYDETFIVYVQNFIIMNLVSA